MAAVTNTYRLEQRGCDSYIVMATHSLSGDELLLGPHGLDESLRFVMSRVEAGRCLMVHALTAGVVEFRVRKVA